MSYLRNTWYVAGWDEELNGEKLLSRRILDEPLVLFRDSHGVHHALTDRCPHRFAPLSLGKLTDGIIQCPYHGLRFDGSGACVHNPHGDGRIPAAARTKSYPIVERYSALWVWMGDPTLANSAAIPDFSCMDPQSWFVGKRYLHVKANYTVWAYRQTVAEVMTEFLYKSMGLPPGMPVDRWFDVRWDPPASLLLFAGATPTGRPREEGPQTLFPHLFTPETQATTHYWFSACYPKAMGDFGAHLAETVVAAVQAPFMHEDLPMLERQQQSIAAKDFWSLKPVLLSGDASDVRARRVLDQLIQDESAGAVSTTMMGA